jgi:hypothetical protein
MIEDRAARTTAHVKRGACEANKGIATTVNKINPARKSRKAKTERGKKSGNALTTIIGTATNSQVTTPQRDTPREVSRINFSNRTYLFSHAPFLAKSDNTILVRDSSSSCPTNRSHP